MSFRMSSSHAFCGPSVGYRHLSSCLRLKPGESPDRKPRQWRIDLCRWSGALCNPCPRLEPPECRPLAGSLTVRPIVPCAYTQLFHGDGSPLVEGSQHKSNAVSLESTRQLPSRAFDLFHRVPALFHLPDHVFWATSINATSNVEQCRPLPMVAQINRN